VRRGKAKSRAYEVLSFVVRKEALQCLLTGFGKPEPTATCHSYRQQRPFGKVHISQIKLKRDGLVILL
jgi:hypothetical protein